MEKIIVFGKGNYYKSKSEAIKSKFEIIAFIDNSIEPGKAEESPIEGIKVYNPQEIIKWKNVKVCLMSRNPIEMCQQLLGYGVDGENIVFGANIPPSMDEHEQLYLQHNVKFSAKKNKIYVIYKGRECEIESTEALHKFNRELYRNLFGEINFLRQLPVEPISRRWGTDCGTPIDRYYIDNFLKNNRKYISGDVMEIADSTYTLKYGDDTVISHVLHVNGWGHNTIKGNLETGEGIVENSMDCLICTQTIQFIYDIAKTTNNIFKLLKNNGTALITAHGIAQLSMYDYRNWGEYWRFTEQTLYKMYADVFGSDNVIVYARGNVKVATAMLYGLTVEDLDKKDFEYDDEQYPIIIEVVAKKRII